MEPQRPRVLVIRGGAIGDFILTLPAIRLLRENIANCHLEALGYPGIVELAKHAGLADATRSLEHRTMASLFAPGASIDPALLEYLRSFNLVVSYLFDPDGILRANLERIGVKTLIECPHRVVDGQGHASEQLARPLQKLAMFLEDPGWRAPLFISTQTATARRIAIHLGSGSEKKNWPAEHWQRLADELQTRHPQTSIVFITGEAEEARGTDISTAFERWHSLPLTELADRLSACQLFLGHDSGISHLASACGVPCVLLFGPTDPATWAPPQSGVLVLRSPVGDMKLLSYEVVRDTAMARLV
ncbi:MAG: glycosyltransferase family 9 protein [Prosthecobacter sp.]